MFSKIKNFFFGTNEEKPPQQNSVIKTTRFITDKIKSIFSGNKQLDKDMIESFQRMLIEADIQSKIVMEITDNLESKFFNSNITEVEVKEFLATAIRKYFYKDNNESHIDPFFKSISSVSNNKASPKVIIMVGVNGAGKTTSLVKIAYKLRENQKVAIVCGDIFRAAADKQLGEWAGRINVDFYAQSEKSDLSGFIYKTINEIKGKYDVIIIDTSGRLHSNLGLMEELSKVERVINKLVEIDECLITIDGSSGQNAINQVTEFKKYVNITGIIVTKLDTSAKGGSIISISYNLGIPVKLIGTGETIHDIDDFNKDDFINNLLDLKKIDPSNDISEKKS